MESGFVAGGKDAGFCRPGPGVDAPSDWPDREGAETLKTLVTDSYKNKSDMCKSLSTVSAEN